MVTEFPVIKTARLLLRQFSGSDLENVFRGLSHPDVIKYYGVSYHSREATKAQMKWFKELEQTGAGTWWAICAPDNNTFYGASGLNNLSREHQKAEIGFWLLPEFWGQGIITEAIPHVCNYGFEKLQLHRIEALVESENRNSKKVMDKLFFTHEGAMRDCEIKNGKFISLDIYARLNTDPHLINIP